MNVQRAVFVTLMSALAFVSVWASHIKVIRHRFLLCDGQGNVRPAILLLGKSCSNFYIKRYVETLYTTVLLRQL